MKGCVASDDFILEVWKRKFESKNPNITITEDTKHLPRNLSACHGIYGSPPEYMGTYYMHEDYNMWGISHVPVSGGCEPMCAPRNSTMESEICNEEDHSCPWSRIYCCDDNMCNTAEGKRKRYKGRTYDQWMDVLEDSMRKRRDVMYNQKHDPEWIIVSGVVINEHSQSGAAVSNISKHALILIWILTSNIFH